MRFEVDGLKPSLTSPPAMRAVDRAVRTWARASQKQKTKEGGRDTEREGGGGKTTATLKSRGGGLGHVAIFPARLDRRRVSTGTNDGKLEITRITRSRNKTGQRWSNAASGFIETIYAVHKTTPVVQPRVFRPGWRSRPARPHKPGQRKKASLG